MRLWRLSQHRTRPSTLSLFHLATSFQCASSHPFIFARLSLTTRGSGNARLCWPSLRPSQELSQVLDFFIKANLSCPSFLFHLDCSGDEACLCERRCVCAVSEACKQGKGRQCDGITPSWLPFSFAPLPLLLPVLHGAPFLRCASLRRLRGPRPRSTCRPPSARGP